jgi:hypothetical protein
MAEQAITIEESCPECFEAHPQCSQQLHLYTAADQTGAVMP